MDRVKNLNIYFWILLIAILMNYGLLWRSWKLQNELLHINPQENWGRAMGLTEFVFFAIIIYLILQVVFRITKKINWIEFSICFSVTVISLLPWIIVVADRI